VAPNKGVSDRSTAPHSDPLVVLISLVPKRCAHFSGGEWACDREWGKALGADSAAELKGKKKTRRGGVFFSYCGHHSLAAVVKL
jgi:hypothetical protein